MGATIDALRELGITFNRYDGMEQDARGIWEAPGGGALVAWFSDPDGNTLSLSSDAPQRGISRRAGAGRGSASARRTRRWR